MLDLSDSRNFSRTLAALGLFLGPLLFVLGTLIDPAWSDDRGEYLQAVGEAPGRYLLAGALWTLGSLLFIPGALGVAKLMRGRGVTLGQVGAGLISIGLILFSANLAFYGIDVAMAQFADREAATGIGEAMEGSSVLGPFFMVTFLGGIVLGSILLAVALFRRHVVPVWSPILIVASTVLGFLGQTQMLSALSLVLLVAGLFPLARKIWSMSDAAWALWEPPAGEPATSTVNSSPPGPAPA